MRMTNVMSAVLMASLMAGGAATSGCKKSSAASVTAESGESIEGKEDTITEVQPEGKVTWYVGPDGQVKAQVKTSDGKPAENLAGTLNWKGPTTEAKLTMTPDPKTGMLTASGPKLAGDLTEIKYSLTVNGKPWSGAIDVPEGGTKDLVSGAKKAAKKDVLKGKKGPNGGVIQVVGDDVVEIVADKGTGQVRVYVLDADLKPVKVGDRKIKLGLVGGATEVVVLNPSPDGLYCFGKLGSKVDPVKITIAVTLKDHCDVVLVGWAPDVEVVVFGPPLISILVVDLHWGFDVKIKVIGDDDDWHWHGHGHGHGHHGHGHGHGDDD
jgi:hypothetical protein